MKFTLGFSSLALLGFGVAAPLQERAPCKVYVAPQNYPAMEECGRAGYRIAAYGDGAYHYVKIESNVASFGALVGKYCGSLDEGHSACWDQYYAQWSYRNGGDYS